MDAAGDARIGVGFITWSMAKNSRLLDLVLERKPAAVMLSFGDVRPHADTIKRAGALLICQVQTLEHAKHAIESNADVLVAQGAEAGGHGISRGTFPLVPAVVDIARGIPVAAAGGVADGRGSRRRSCWARTACWWERASMRRMRPRDSTARRSASWPRPAIGRRAASCSTSRAGMFGRPRSAGVRCEMNFPSAGAGAKPNCCSARPKSRRSTTRPAQAGDFDTAAVIAGEAADLISDILPAAEVVERMAAQASSLLEGASNRYRVSSSSRPPGSR